MFIDTYTAVDLETPNNKGNSLCSIGIVHIEPGHSPVRREYLINPEDCFDDLNISIHGITPQMVSNAPTFPQVWPEISSYFTTGIVVAHNATFDLTVLHKTLERYAMPIPDFYYICTLQKARRHIPKETFGNHQLKTLCSGLGIMLDKHHNALDDAAACAELFAYLNQEYPCDDSDINRFKAAITPTSSTITATEAEKALNTLHGILLGIGFDKRIPPIEQKILAAWAEEHRLLGNPDIRLCRKALIDILADGIITIDEHRALMNLTDREDCSSQFCKTTKATQLLMGIIEGVAGDNVINDEEATCLLAWMHDYEYLKGFYPYDKVFAILKPMMADQHIDIEEQNKLLSLIDSIINPAANPEVIIFEGNTFCLTGNFTRGTKESVAALIRARNGLITDSVSKKVQYVVVGGEGSEKWAFGNYGGKVQKALGFNEKGYNIRIISESLLYDD